MRSTKATTKPAGTRSTQGCWTCRLRRKKCDETRPECQTCASLSIACYGYGPRPPWMDRGPLEKEKAQSIKSEIARSGLKRRRPRLFSTASLGNGVEAGSDAGTDSCDRPVTQLETALCFSKCLPKRHQTTLDDVFDDDFNLSSSMAMQQMANDVMAPRRMSIVGGEMSPSDILSADESELGRFSFPVDPLLRLGRECESSEPTFDYETYLRMDTFPPMQTSESLPGSLHRLSDSVPPDTPSCCFGTPSGTKNGSPRALPGEIPLRDAISLSNYLENTLSAQFPFRRVSDVGCRQWLEILLLSSKQVLGVTLLLGGAPHGAGRNTDIGQERNVGNDVSRAMSILRSLPSATSSLSLLDEELQGSHVISACTCVMQTVFLEVYLGGASRWASFLEQAAPYMHSLIDLVCSEKEGIEPSTATKHAVHQVQAAAAEAVLGQMVWFDIIGLVSTGHGPSLGTNHSFLLDSNAFDLRETSGCENWVAKSLYEIHGLRTWKAKEIGAQRLCIIKLAERGGKILEVLKRHMTVIKEGLLPHTESRHRADDGHSPSAVEPLEQDLKIITMAYATAAVIYLHVIVSGPTPLLEDIRRETPRLVEYLKVLAGRGLLCHVSLPLCVASCFMEDHDFDFFKEFVATNRHARPGWFETCDRAIMVAQECRKQQEDGRRCDWIDVTQESGWKFLLV